MTSRPRLAAPGPVRELYVELDAAAEAGAAAAPATDLTNNDDDPLSDLPEQLPSPVDCRGRRTITTYGQNGESSGQCQMGLWLGYWCQQPLGCYKKSMLWTKFYLGVATRADHCYPAERLLCGGDS